MKTHEIAAFFLGKKPAETKIESTSEITVGKIDPSYTTQNFIEWYLSNHPCTGLRKLFQRAKVEAITIAKKSPSSNLCTAFAIKTEYGYYWIKPGTNEIMLSGNAKYDYAPAAVFRIRIQALEEHDTALVAICQLKKGRLKVTGLVEERHHPYENLEADKEAFPETYPKEWALIEREDGCYIEELITVARQHLAEKKQEKNHK